MPGGLPCYDYNSFKNIIKKICSVKVFLPWLRPSLNPCKHVLRQQKRKYKRRSERIFASIMYRTYASLPGPLSLLCFVCVNIDEKNVATPEIVIEIVAIAIVDVLEFGQRPRVGSGGRFENLVGVPLGTKARSRTRARSPTRSRSLLDITW